MSHVTFRLYTVIGQRLFSIFSCMLHSFHCRRPKYQLKQWACQVQREIMSYLPSIRPSMVQSKTSKENKLSRAERARRHEEALYLKFKLITKQSKLLWFFSKKLKFWKKPNKTLIQRNYPIWAIRRDRRVMFPMHMSPLCPKWKWRIKILIQMMSCNYCLLFLCFKRFFSNTCKTM